MTRLRKIAAIALASTALAAATLWPARAEAWTQLTCGGVPVKWSSPTLRYVNNAGTLGPAAANAWGAKSGPLSLSAVSPTSGDPHFWVKAQDYGGSLGANGKWRKIGTANSIPSCSGGYWVKGDGEAVIDLSTQNSTGDQAVTSHEIGHALGLNHNQATRSCSPGLGAVAVLYQGDLKWNSTCPVTLPTNDDGAGATALYGA